ncbi:MAG TPA: hypothetical protein EYH34_07340 [Planctomycetes bacterium]|nr:hypothetical protein [Planctomycetota bacterium]
MAVVERDFGLPRGAEYRKRPAYRYSYLWARRPTPENIGQYIRWAKRGGFRMILFSYTAFSKGAGHFEWNANYPNGTADLKEVTQAIREAGLAVGLHIHYNKAHKHDPYVTPTPDERLHKVRQFTLAADIDDRNDALPVRQNPSGCTMDEGRRLLKVGHELVEYERYTTERPYRFLGCQRGALETLAATHKAGAEVALLDVDTWPAFIRFDQNTDIQDETAERLAEIINGTGPYEMIYFDGAEDVHTPFWYHCANAQWRVYRRIAPSPPVGEAAANTHFSWHMITRSNAYDSVGPAEMKEFCRRAPCRFAPVRALDFSRIEFGWLHGFGRSRSSYITPDTLEYVISRAAAWDCPFSMSVTLKELNTNPRTESCFELIKTWEDARLSGKLTDAWREQLRNLDQEHHLLVSGSGRYELVTIHALPVAGSSDAIKAYWFHRKDKPAHTYVLLWATGDDVELRMPLVPDRVAAMRPFGRLVELGLTDGRSTVPVSERMYLTFAGMRPDEVAKLLQRASVALIKRAAKTRPVPGGPNSASIAARPECGPSFERLIQKLDQYAHHGKGVGRQTKSVQPTPKTRCCRPAAAKVGIFHRLDSGPVRAVTSFPKPRLSHRHHASQRGIRGACARGAPIPRINPKAAERKRRMGILARQSWARPATAARAANLTFRDVYDAQAIAPFVPLMTDRNIHPALSVYNAGVKKV